MATRTAASLRHAQLDLATARLAGGRLLIFDGAPPLGFLDTPTAPVLAAFTLGPVPFAPAVAGAAQLYPLAPVLVQRPGVAGWFRLLTAAGEPQHDGTITATGGGGALEFDNPHFSTAGECCVERLALTLPE